ncbi:Protein cms1 [Cladophialophora chaetospira]|uniref:Protein cms1 n=1 Tax=Cladophialophora chaetospira TaxID=386627 RepID=A0AA38X7J8_9EURO|nr:Protein cms1 [Cladophialophora chaetospira]
MSRTKTNHLGLRSQLKRKREVEDSGEVENNSAKRAAKALTPAPKGKRAKGDSKRPTIKGAPKDRPATDSKSSRPPENESKDAKTPTNKDEPRRTSTPEAANATEKDSSPAPNAVLDPALLADHFANCIRKSFDTSSSIELEEQYLPSKAFLDTTGFDKNRIAANLPAYLERFSIEGKDGLSTCKEKASPHTLVVTLSGMRTADLARELRVFQNDESHLGKLIAKHMKLKDNIKLMQETKIGIAISTPMRFKQLIDADALKTRDLRRIVVDGSYRDDKKNTILTMNQTFQPLVALLNEDTIRKRYGTEEGRVDILVF